MDGSSLISGPTIIEAIIGRRSQLVVPHFITGDLISRLVQSRMQPALFAVPCSSRFQHCMSDPAFLFASLYFALLPVPNPKVQDADYICVLPWTDSSKEQPNGHKS